MITPSNFKIQIGIIVLFIFSILLLFYQEIRTQTTLGVLISELRSQQNEGQKQQSLLRVSPLQDTTIKDNQIAKQQSQPLSNTIPTLNIAPTIEVYPDQCRNGVLWGREHHGGWYICKDKISVNNCIIYSFGLGK